jgi:hypothetical protein
MAMAGGDCGNAMTEIALALAMAFFAIMILTMVSMGGQGRATQVTQTIATPNQIRLLAPEGQTSQGRGAARVLQARDLIIFTDGRFFDDKLRPLDPNRMAAMKAPVLAVAPSLSLAAVMAAKARLALPDLTVTTLNQHWLDAIKEHRQ